MGSKHRTHTQFVQDIKQRHGRKYTILSVFSSVNAKIFVRCNDCGEEKEKFPSWLLAATSGTGCRKCSTFRFESKEYSKTLHRVNKTIIPVETYVNMLTNIKHRCLICQHEWSARPCNLVYNKSKCPACSRKMTKVSLGRTKVKVQGYEPMALDILKKKFKPSDIVVASSNQVPKINYKFANKHRLHTPDIWIPKKNILFEVKAASTLGLVSSKFSQSKAKLFYKNASKSRAAKRQGFDYRLLLLRHDGTSVRVPKNWDSLSYREVLSKVKL